MNFQPFSRSSGVLPDHPPRPVDKIDQAFSLQKLADVIHTNSRYQSASVQLKSRYVSHR